MSGQDYLKYLTAEITAYLELPAHIKKERKLKRARPLSSNRWFGLLPFMFKVSLHRKSSSKFE